MSRRLVVAIVTLQLLGCKGCRNDHPYVPYTIEEDGAPTTTAAEDDDAEALPAPHEISATQAPAHATRWTLAGVSIAAPPGMVFELGIARDFDGDGSTDVVALVRHDDKDQELGSLVLYKANAGGMLVPTTIAPSPSFAAPAVSTCEPKRKLSAIGHHSVWVELGLQCNPATKEPLREVMVWALRAQPREHFSALVADPPGAPKLSLLVDAPDLDNDGLDDVLVRVAVEGGDAPFEPLPRAEAKLRFFDRPAGMSRDPDDPDGSLRAVASTLAVRAAKAKDAPQVLAQARAVRVLWSALCADGQSPRLVKVLGASLTCGPSRALEEAGLAEARAHAVLGDALGAVTSLDAAQLAPATKTPSRTKDAEAWINQIAPSTQATQVRAIAAVAQSSRASGPAWGALAFEPSGKLIVRTAAGAGRVDPDNGDETAASDVAWWPPLVLAPDGSSRWAGAFDPCDGVSLHATLSAAGDAGSGLDVALPIAPSIGARCYGGRPTPGAAIPLAWGAGGLEAIVAGQPVLIAGGRASLLHAPLGQTTPRGSARSPDGKTFAVPTSRGVLVVGAKSRILRSPDLDGTYGELRDCTASDDGTRVACIHAGKAWVATF